ncbi:MAG TPA: PAS domain-containing protein [Rhizomicrobium sp.]|nr:PAS domain-containing protein [Rhizomicrobium sp.]
MTAPPGNPTPIELLALHIHRGPDGPLHPRLKALLACWNEKRGQRRMPARAELPLQVLKPWLGHLALLEPEQGGFRVRLGGTELSPRFGRETTGLELGALAPGIRKGLRATIDLAYVSRAPVISALSIRREGRKTLYSELLLPLAGDGAMMFLLGCYPVTARDTLS